MLVFAIKPDRRGAADLNGEQAVNYPRYLKINGHPYCSDYVAM
jgi:hypothetical protein